MVDARKDPTERRRRALVSALIILFVVGGGAIAAVSGTTHWRSVDFVRMGAILFLSFLLAARATTSLRFTPRNPALDDELTRANRANAAAWGFWILMIGLLGLFAASFVEPIGVQEAAPLLIIAGAAAAGLRFVFLERTSA